MRSQCGDAFLSAFGLKSFVWNDLWQCLMLDPNATISYQQIESLLAKVVERQTGTQNLTGDLALSTQFQNQSSALYVASWLAAKWPPSEGKQIFAGLILQYRRQVLKGYGVYTGQKAREKMNAAVAQREVVFALCTHVMRGLMELQLNLWTRFVKEVLGKVDFRSTSFNDFIQHPAVQTFFLNPSLLRDVYHTASLAVDTALAIQ